MDGGTDNYASRDKSEMRTCKVEPQPLRMLGSLSVAPMLT